MLILKHLKTLQHVKLAKIPYTPWLELYPVQHTSPRRTPRIHTKW